jgi:hypothetical protein
MRAMRNVETLQVSATQFSDQAGTGDTTWQTPTPLVQPVRFRSDGSRWKDTPTTTRDAYGMYPCHSSISTVFFFYVQTIWAYFVDESWLWKVSGPTFWFPPCSWPFLIESTSVIIYIYYLINYKLLVKCLSTPPHLCMFAYFINDK